MLPQMVLPIETFTTLLAHLVLLTRMYNIMQIKVLLAFEPLHANGANKRPLRVVSEFMSLQVLLALQPRPANIANESTLDFMPHQVLLEQLLLRVRHVAFRATEQCCSIEGGGNMNLAGLWPTWLRRLLLTLLLLFLLIRFFGLHFLLGHIRYY